MQDLSVAEDIVPIGEFRSRSGELLDRVRTTGQPVVITQHGKPAAVVVSPADFDRFRAVMAYRQSIEKGLAEADAGETVPLSEVRAWLASRRKPA